jgi:hypothetical protein
MPFVRDRSSILPIVRRLTLSGTTLSSARLTLVTSGPTTYRTSGQVSLRQSRWFNRHSTSPMHSIRLRAMRSATRLISLSKRTKNWSAPGRALKGLHRGRVPLPSSSCPSRTILSLGRNTFGNLSGNGSRPVGTRSQAQRRLRWRHGPSRDLRFRGQQRRKAV